MRDGARRSDESLCLVIVGRPDIKRCWENFSEGVYNMELAFDKDLIVELRDSDAATGACVADDHRDQGGAATASQAPAALESSVLSDEVNGLYREPACHQGCDSARPSVVRSSSRMNSAVQPLVVLVEDDLRLAELVRTYLQGNGFRVAVENRGDRVVERVQRESPDLVDSRSRPARTGRLLGLPRAAGDLLGIPILMLTARDNDIDHVVGLELGADDYVIKPVEPRVLVARIHALLRRGRRPAASKSRTLRFGTLSINSAARVRHAARREPVTAVQQRVRSAVVPRLPRRRDPVARDAVSAALPPRLRRPRSHARRAHLASAQEARRHRQAGKDQDGLGPWLCVRARRLGRAARDAGSSRRWRGTSCSSTC